MHLKLPSLKVDNYIKWKDKSNTNSQSEESQIAMTSDLQKFLEFNSGQHKDNFLDSTELFG